MRLDQVLARRRRIVEFGIGGGGGLGGLPGGGLGSGKSEERQEQQIGVAHRAENLRERGGGGELSQPPEACPVRYAPRTTWKSRDRKSVEEGKSVAGPVDIGGRRI